MASTFKQPGKVLTHANGSGSDISAGDVVVMQDSVGVALVDIDNGESGSVSVAGVHELAKSSGSGEGWTQGEVLNFDTSEAEFTTNAAASGDIEGCAVAAADADDDDTTGEVLLDNPGAAQ